MKLLTQLITDLTEGLADTITDTKGGSSNASYGKRNELLSSRGEGFIIDGKVNRRTSLEIARRNAIVFGNSGSGKSEVFVKPLLLSLKCSAIVNNGGGNLTDAIAYQQSQGITVLVLHLSKRGRVRLNVLNGCKDNPQEIRRIVRGIMGSAGEMKRDFFTIAGEDTLFIFICFVLESPEIEEPTLADAYDLMVEYQGHTEKIAERFAREASEGIFNSFLGKVHKLSDNTRKSVLATSITALSWLGESPVLRAVSSHSSFRWEDFRHSPHSLYIDFNSADAELLAPMVSLIFQSFYRFAFSQLPPRDGSVLDIMLIMDEFHTLLTGLPDFSSYISVSRKYHIPTLLIGQSPSQLSKFGELKGNILANCYLKCYFGGMSLEIAKELEAICGEVEYKEKESKQVRKKPLFSAYDIRQMNNEILVVPSSGKSLKLKVHPAYTQTKLQRKLAMSTSETSHTVLSQQNNDTNETA